MISINNSCSILSEGKSFFEIQESDTCTFKKVWETQIDIDFNNFYSNLSPAFKNDIVYIADQSIVQAINIKNGKLKWQQKISSQKEISLISGGISIYDEILYFGTEKGQLYAINIQNGSVIWKKKIFGEILSFPVVNKKKLILHSTDGMLQTYNKKTGKRKWIKKLYNPKFLSLRGLQTPKIILNHIIIIGSDNGNLNLLGLNRGKTIWKNSIALSKGDNKIERINDIDHKPIVKKNKIYTFANNNYLSVLDLQSGKIIWKSKENNDAIKELFLDKRTIYIITNDNVIQALNIKNKIAFWDFSRLSKFKLERFILYGEYIIILDSKGTLYWIDKSNGELVYNKNFEKQGIKNFVMLSNNKLLIQSKKGNIYIIKINFC